MSPEESAALIAGAITALGVFLNLFVTVMVQRRRHVHETELESVKAQLMKTIESHRSILEEQVNQKNQHLEAELIRISSDLSKSKDLYAASIPLQQQVRQHLTDTHALLPRVFVSFARLSRLAPSLDEHDILTETTNTLDLYAEYRQHLSSHQVVSYPPEVRSLLKEIQDEVIRKLPKKCGKA